MRNTANGSLARGTLSILSSNIGTNLLGLASGFALARGLGPTSRGEYQIAVLCYTLIPALIGLNLGTIIAGSKEGRSVSLPRARSVLGILVGSGGVLAGVVSYMSGLDPRACAVLGFSSLGYMTSDLLLGIARRNEMYNLFASVRWLDVGGSSICIVLLFLAGKLSVFLATVALVIPTCLAMLYLAYRLQGRFYDSSTNGFDVGNVAKVHAGGATRVLASYVDQVLVGILLGYSGLGIYALAFSLASQLNVVQGALVAVGFNVVRRDAEDRGERVSFIIRVQTLAAVSIGLVCWFLGPEFFELVFGPEYRESGRVAAFLFLAVGLNGIVGILELVLIAAGHAGSALLARLVGLASLPVGIGFTMWGSSVILATSIPILTSGVATVAAAVSCRRNNSINVWSLLRVPSKHDLEMASNLLRRTRRGSSGSK